MVALAVFMMIFTIVSVSTFDRADRNLFGYKAFIVLSDSMSKSFWILMFFAVILYLVVIYLLSK